MTNTERIKTVVKTTLQTLFIMNIFILLLLWADNVDSIDWDFIVYVNLYGFILSVVFGFLDKPKLENKILIFLSILSFLIWVIPNKFSTHFRYVFYGIFLGRVSLNFVDLALKYFKSKIKKVKKNPPQ